MKIPVYEHFETFQGEGDHAGKHAHFIRLYACDQKCPWCLGPNTEILFANGPKKKIKDVVVGDVLVGFDEASGQLEETEVVATKEHEAPVLLSLTTRKEGAAYKGHSTICTPEHQFYVKSRGWQRADALREGDIILSGKDLNIMSWRMRGNKNPMKDAATRAQVSETMQSVWTPAKRQKQRETHIALAHIHRARMLGDKNPMKDSKIAHKAITSRKYKTTKIELRVKRLIDELGFSYTHNVKMKRRIGRRYPDFYDDAARKVLEVYDPTFKPDGSALNRQELGYAGAVVSDYERHGFKALPLAVPRRVSNDQIVRELTEFTLNGHEVVSVEPLSTKAHGALGGRPNVHDITCSPHPTFFANGLLTHNCDSAGTWHKDYRPTHVRNMTAQEVAELPNLPEGGIVVITGGEPTLYDLTDLTSALANRGLRVHLETAGHRDIRGNFDWITLSPKPFAKHPLLASVAMANEFKIIVDSKTAIRDAMATLDIRSAEANIWLHPEWGLRNDPDIIDSIISTVKLGHPFRAGLQMHKYYNVDTVDPNARKEAIPLGGDPARGSAV